MGLKKFLQQSSEKKQNFKMVVLGIAVLVATIAATLLTGWITASKSSPPKEQLPQIVFEKETDLLLARSDSHIKEWQYIGPRSQSLCNAAIFKEFVGFGNTFQTGNVLRLDFERDHNKHYCFKATATNQTVSFKSYHVEDLVKPAIVFVTQDNRLKALLAAEIDSRLYTKNWQYVSLDATAACNQQAFLETSQIGIGQTLDLNQVDQGRFYCFRLADLNHNYLYQAKYISVQLSTKPELKVQQFSNKLYLTSNQSIRKWQAKLIEVNENCQVSTFESNFVQIEAVDQTVIFLPPDKLESTYCLRVQNQSGVDNYYKYNRPTEIASITIEARLFANYQINLKATSQEAVSSWQIAMITDVDQCQAENFANQVIISNQADISLEWISDQPRLYCWQAISEAGKTYALEILPASTQTILPYLENNQLKTETLIESLNNWQYMSQNFLINETVDCQIATFQPLNQPLLIDERQLYCLTAKDRNQASHYSPLIVGAHYPQLNPTNRQVALANYLKLSTLGRYILYKTSLRYHIQLTSLQTACSQKVTLGCYLAETQTIHLLSKHPFDNQSLLKSFILKIAWDDYLTAQQKLLLNLHARIAQQVNPQAWKKKITASFHNKHLFAENFQKGVYDLMIDILLNPDQLEKQNAFWLAYYSLFFE